MCDRASPEVTKDCENRAGVRGRCALKSLLFSLVVVGLTAVAPARFNSPTFVRQWTVHTGDQSIELGVVGRTGIIGSEDGVTAVDLSAGVARWRACQGRKVTAGSLRGSRLVALLEREKTNFVALVDARSGRVAREFAAPELSGDIAFIDERVCVLDKHGVLHALSLKTGASVWKRALAQPKKDRYQTGTVQTAGSLLLASIDGVGYFAVDPRSGNVRWSRPDSWYSLSRPIAVGDTLILSGTGIAKVRLADGKELWWLRYETGAALVRNHLVVVDGGDKLTAYSLGNGGREWTLRVPLVIMSSGARPLPDQGNPRRIWVDQPTTYCVSDRGKLLWRRDQAFDGSPMLIDGETVVTVDRSRVLGYRMGAYPALPDTEAARKERAERLVAKFEDLDANEIALLSKLGHHVAPPLLKRYVSWALGRKEGARRRWIDTNDEYRLLEASAPVLMAVCDRRDTTQLQSGIDSVRENQYRRVLMSILYDKGDPAVFVPALVDSLRQGEEGENFDLALEAVGRSRHPKAVAYMLEALADPKASRYQKSTAFLHLADTGGAAGREAVRRLKVKREPLAPWYERLKVNPSAKSTLSIRDDDQGQTWALVRWDGLGRFDHLFIVPKAADGWGRPVFTGVESYVEPRTKPPVIRGVPLAKLVDSEWIRLFPNDPSLRKDTDGDGLTDLVEARYRTDARKADTDGDGLSDLVDPCPDVAPRALGETERVIAAAAQAMFFQHPQDGPAFFTVEKVRPFEIPGLAMPLLWDRRKPEDYTELPGLSIGAANPGAGDRPNAPVVEFGRDGKSARVDIGVSDGPLNGGGTVVFLKKLDGEWFVVDVKPSWVS